MGDSLIPIAIVVGGIASVVCVFAAAWRPLSRSLHGTGDQFAHELELSGVTVRLDALGYVVLAAAVIAWLALVMLTRPAPLSGLLELAAVAGLALSVTKAYLRYLVRRRIARFGDQFETTLRMLAGAVRVGLGLRQALIHVAEQIEEPSRHELTRLVGATNLGIGVVDALDELAVRMALPETRMLARVIRVQSHTGGELGGVLEGLADTIRDRRRFQRRVRVITSQGRATAWLLGLLPVSVGVFIMVTQPDLRAVTLASGVGRTGLLLSLALDAVAAAVLLRLAKVNA
jgi:tight adherence protein B